MICLMHMVQLIRTFAFSHTAPPGHFYISSGLQCVSYDTVTSSHSKVLIAQLFPLASVNSLPSGTGREMEKDVSCSYLAVLHDHVLLSQKVTADLGHVNRNCMKNF